MYSLQLSSHPDAGRYRSVNVEHLCSWQRQAMSRLPGTTGPMTQAQTGS